MASAQFRHYTIKAEGLFNKRAPFSDDKYENWNYHKVTIVNRNTRKQASFDFWASLANPDLRSPSDLRDAFSCFISDATCADESFENFCANMGYDSDSRKAEKIYKACQAAHRKAVRVIDEDLYDLAEFLQ